MAGRVRLAREAQAGRAGGGQSPFNARLAPETLREAAALDPPERRILEKAMTALALSAGAHDRVLRVARTIADLDGSAAARSGHVAEALQYRCLDRPADGPPVAEAP